jgi:hypothetical protein
MKKIPILLFIIILISCRDEEKYHFIAKVMKNPDSLELYLSEAKFGTKRFKISLSPKDDGIEMKIKFLNDIMDEFKNGYSLIQDRISTNETGWIHKYGIDTCHFIVLKVEDILSSSVGF